MSRIEKNYELAREQYAELGVDTEAAKALPWGAVWQYFCEKTNSPQDWDVINPIREYEKTVLVNR